MAAERLHVRCPICAKDFDLPMLIRVTLTHGENGRKGFITADVGVGGMEHTCVTPERAVLVEARQDLRALLGDLRTNDRTRVGRIINRISAFLEP